MDTETLANLKQSLYFDGIRGQIDSGAWEKMEQIKRLEGFDHQFLWLRPGHTLLGLMWSSSDRIGRAKYPMILCADGEGFSPAFMLAYAGPELERLRDSCKSLTSADEVTSECRAALGRLRGTFERAGGGWSEPFSDATERQLFLDCAELSPDRAGFLRILHEYTTEQGMASAGKKTKHLRVPVISSLRIDALTPWVEFFRCVVPSKVPVLFIKRNGESWLDVVIGEPDSRDFFCLQAATDALPLTTQVPYEISADTRSALDAVAARFGLSAGPTRQSRPKAPPVPMASPVVPAAGKGGFRLLMLIALIVIVILAGIALVVVFKSKNSPAQNPSGSLNKSGTPAAGATPAANAGVKYANAIQAATDAFAKGDYDGAISQANIALQCEPGDQAATQVKADALKKKKDSESQASSYSGAMTAARNALAAGHYDEALRQVKSALAFSPGDSAAMTLDATIESRQDADAKSREDQYNAAMAQGRQALANKNYSEAGRQAGIALGLKAGDNDAKDLMARATGAQSDQQRQHEYDTAMQAARQAFERKDFNLTIQNANAALAARADDADATALKSKAQSAQATDAAYQTAMQAAQTAFNNKNYDVAIQQADAALANRPGDAAATTLKNNATSEWTGLQKNQQYQSEVNAVQAAWNKSDFDTVIQNANLALQITPGATDLKSRLRDSIYNKLEIYAVWFGVIKPQQASFPVAKTQSPLAQGDMAPSAVNAYRNQIDGWLKTLKQYQLLDDAHTKLAASIEDNINRYY
ncbi:MAG TPA: hypothetical protein VGJ73_19360 [Verrucomicrobiae bacterium]